MLRGRRAAPACHRGGSACLEILFKVWWCCFVGASIGAESAAQKLPTEDDVLVARSAGAMTARSDVILAALVISGHKAAADKNKQSKGGGGQQHSHTTTTSSSEAFIRQSACAFATMLGSAVDAGAFDGDAVLMAGPLGARSPHDRKGWHTASEGWEREHTRLTHELGVAVAATTGARVWDLVPLLKSNKYPSMKFNLNYMKLAVLELTSYSLALFLDLDLVVVSSLTPVLDAARRGKYRDAALIGYRTCTAPVNSGFFVVKPSKRGPKDLAELDAIVTRNGCPCRHDKSPFGDVGYDGRGPTRDAIAELWRGTRLCRDQLSGTGENGAKNPSWRFAGAGTGQGLMWYYYGVRRKSYASLTYADLPVVHYNLNGPKPWARAVSEASNDVTRKQHCDYVWWRAARRRAAADDTDDDRRAPVTTMYTAANNASSLVSSRRIIKPSSSSFAHKCFRRHLGPLFADKVDRGHFHVPSCCRTCPGGGHFSTAQACASTDGLSDYGRTSCKVVDELSAADADYDRSRGRRALTLSSHSSSRPSPATRSPDDLRGDPGGSSSWWDEPDSSRRRRRRRRSQRSSSSST